MISKKKVNKASPGWSVARYYRYKAMGVGKGCRIVEGDTKRDLIREMNEFPQYFQKGKKVLVWRQTREGVGCNKFIIWGEKWTLPKKGDEEVKKERGEGGLIRFVLEEEG